MKSQKLVFLALGIVLSWTSSFAQNQAQDGEWSNPIPFGIVPVAVANLPDGRLLCWSSQFRNTFITSGDGATFTEIFDPFQGSDGLALGEFTSNTNHDMFCPGINNLADGRILAAGGTSSEKTSIYDWQTGLWSVADEMNIPRGYQGNVTLSDGSVFTVGGSWSGGAWTNRDAEIWTESSGWQLLPNIKGDDFYTANDVAGDSFQSLYRVDNHIWLWVAPDGNLFHPGPSEQMHWVNTVGNGSMVSAGFRSNDGFSMKGTTVMFDIGKILKVGGAESYDDRDPANDNSYVIDINGGYGSTPTVIPTSNKVQFPRTMHNSTVLPNGEVLITGGLSESLVFTDGGARLTAEIFNPTTNSWRSVAGMQTPRTYHSVAILMVDGRVFVGGGGLCPTPTQAGCVDHFDAEIYSPPYLFDASGNLASRPVISAPDFAGYNSTIGVTGTSGIQEFSLIRFSAATHSTNNEQRRIPVSFTENGGNYQISIPDKNLLPPGYYMLFALNSSGVPSIAETIQIGESGGNLPPVAVASSDVQSGAAPLTVNFTGSGSSDDVGIVSYSWDFGDGNVSTVADPQHTYSNPGNYTATLTVTDGGPLTDSATVPIAVNATGGGGCPDALPNDDPSLALLQGGGFQGLDSFVGTSVDTNGSPCGLSITNSDSGQPWSNYRIKIDLAAHGITAGDDLFISLDGNGGSGVARMEVNRDNSPNTAVMAHTYGGGWSTHSETVTVPPGISSLDIWLYSNYNQSGSGGTAHYDNLIVTNLGNNGNQPPAVDDEDLIVYLNFEESNGTVVSDDSGFSNDFTVIERDDFANPVTANDHTWGSSGVFGNALELDGKFHNSNSILELPFNSVIDDIENEITVTAWVWRDSGSMVPQTGKPANVAVFAHDYPAIFGGFHNWLVKWSFATDNGFVDCYAGHAPLNQWTHFSITYDGQRARLYSNGIEVCDKPITGNISLRNDSTPNSRFTASGFYEHRTDLPVVPYGNESEITDELDGRLDDFRIYRRALSSQEIRDIYLVGLNTGTSGIPDCTILPITAEYKIGQNGSWTEGTTISAPLGSEVFIRARNYGQEYFITTNAYDGPTISSVNDTNRLTSEGAYQIDTFVYDFGDPNRNNGFFDIHNVGQYALTTTNGCSTVINLVASNAPLQASVSDFKEEIGGEVILTPNPGNSQVQVYFPEIIKSGSISLFDMNGRLLEIVADGELLSPIDFFVENYPNGVYIVVLEYGEERIRKKLLIKR